MNFGYQNDALNARNAQSMEETPESAKQVQLQFRGPIIRSKTSFSFNVNGNDRYTSNNLIAVDRSNNRIGEEVQVPTDQRNVNASIEHALTTNSTLRLGYQGSQTEASHQGLGNFDLPQRARTTESAGNMFRAQVQGIVGKRASTRSAFSSIATRTRLVADAGRHDHRAGRWNLGGAGVTAAT